MEAWLIDSFLSYLRFELGYSEMDFTPVAELCRRLNVPYTRVKTDISHVVFDVRQEVNPCSLCSKMRRGALDNALKARGCNKLALGHHMDDAVETFVMSLLFEGRISCFKPVTYLSRADVTQIRPMIYAGEQRTVVYLPLCHVLGRDVAVTLPLISHLVPHFGEDPEDLVTSFFETAPTVLFTVPRYLQKFASQVLIGTAKPSSLERNLDLLKEKVPEAAWAEFAALAIRP